jgi:hypothetical protein
MKRERLAFYGRGVRISIAGNASHRPGRKK